MSDILSEEDLQHLREIRVCDPDDDVTPVLDGIGADWISNHFEAIIGTIDHLRAELATVEKVLTYAWHSVNCDALYCTIVIDAEPCDEVRENHSERHAFTPGACSCDLDAALAAWQAAKETRANDALKEDDSHV